MGLSGCAPKREPIYAFNAGGNGTLSESEIAWISQKGRDISSTFPHQPFTMETFPFSAMSAGAFACRTEKRDQMDDGNPWKGQV